jgi:hypothetical protein
MSDLIAEGTYEAVAFPIDTADGPAYAQFGESAQKATPQVVVNCEILDGEEVGRRIAWIGYFTEATTQRTVESLRYFGFKGDDLATLVTQKLEQRVQIVVEHEDYNNRTRARVSWVNRPGGGGLRLSDPMSKDGLRKFAARMKAAVRAIPEATGAKAEGGARPAPKPSTPPTDGRRDDAPPHGDDDGIPF